MKVLVIDDEADLRETMGRLLLKEGFEVVYAENGEKGKETFYSQEFDIVIIDMLLGDMNGIDLVKRFKDNKPHVEIMMVSGYGTFGDVVYVIKCGAQDFIEKPIDPELFLSKIRRIVKIRKLNLDFKYLDEQYNNIRELKEYNENIINQLPQGLLSINRDDTIVNCNAYIKNKFCKTVKISECPNCSVKHFFTSYFDSSEKILESYERLKQERVSFDFVVLNNTMEPNVGAHFRITGCRFSAGILLFINDITEDYNLKQKVLENEKVANMGKFVLGITHGLGNNMANIMANVSGVEEESQTILKKLEHCSLLEKEPALQADMVSRLKRMQEYLLRLDKRVKEMDQNIKSMLSHSRQQPVYRALTDINKLVEEAVIIVQSKNYPDISYEKHLDANLPQTLVNPYQIKDVFVDLILNGIQAMDAKKKPGVLSYGTEYDKEQNLIRVRISDTGIGILPQDTTRIFDAFYTTKPTGTGLGLPNVKSIIKQHEGRIRFESEPGKGTIFFVELKVLT
jgi:signal transduction histidine kinase/FixJ family two-component response regulator